jgi:ribosomal protein S18 acetylase RimI-like enzyme
VTPNDAGMLLALFDTLPARDRTFLERRLNLAEVQGWGNERGVARLLVERDGTAAAYLAVISHGGWSNHVGDLRLVVAAACRRQGIGRILARRGLIEGVELGLAKITVEVAAENEGDIAMFTSIGFRAEALLEDHIRDGDGNMHDLVLLSHDVERVRADLAAIGIETALGLPGA